MSKFSTIHIFGYGETQIIGSELNFKTKSTDLTSLPALIDFVKTKRPEGIDEAPHHAIHIFEGTKVDFASTVKKGGYSIKWEDVDATLVNALADELLVLDANVPG